jgi:hypothetical protein
MYTHEDACLAHAETRSTEYAAIIAEQVMIIKSSGRDDPRYQAALRVLLIYYRSQRSFAEHLAEPRTLQS